MAAMADSCSPNWKRHFRNHGTGGTVIVSGGYSCWDDSKVAGNLGRRSRCDDPLDTEPSDSSCNHNFPIPSFAFREHLHWWSLSSFLR